MEPINITPETLPLTDAERVALFADVVIPSLYIGVIPEIISETTAGGILKPAGAFEREKEQLDMSSESGVLVGLSNNAGHTDKINPGDRVAINIHVQSRPIQTVTRDNHDLIVYDRQHVVLIFPQASA